jgi:hypothetical protein
MRDRDPFDHGGMEEALRRLNQHQYQYGMMDARDRERRREEEASPWRRAGDFNVMKTDRLPAPERPCPSHSGDRGRS